MFAGAERRLRALVGSTRALRGLSAGAGCGVGVGYGFGAGLFLSPAEGDALAARFAVARDALAARLPAAAAALAPPPQALLPQAQTPAPLATATVEGGAETQREARQRTRRTLAHAHALTRIRQSAMRMAGEPSARARDAAERQPRRAAPRAAHASQRAMQRSAAARLGRCGVRADTAARGRILARMSARFAQTIVVPTAQWRAACAQGGGSMACAREGQANRR
jgi:hypothetical protein